MNTSLYVGNLPYNTTEEALSQHFSAAGNVVSANIITDRETGRSRGFAFVQMATPKEAKAAIEMLNDQDFDGRPLRVNEAKPKQ